MKKKFFAVALATTMALSTALTATAETKDTLSSSSPFVNTGDEKLTGNFDVTYSFHTKSTLNENWDTFAIEFYSDAVSVGSTGKGFLTLRADAYGWWAEGWNEKADGKEPVDVNLNWKGTDAGWDNWKTDVSDADVTINAKRSGETISVQYDIKGSNGTSYTFTNSVENVYGFGDSVLVHLTMAQNNGVQVDLTNIKFTDNAAGGNNTPAPTTTGGNNTSDPTTTAGGNNTPATTAGKTTPKTGDVAPVAALAAVAVVACAAVVVSKKKVTE